MTSECFACNFSFIKYEYSIGTKFRIQYKIFLYNFLFIKLKPKKTEKMKTQNKIHDLFATPINQFTNEELNILFNHTFDMFVYTVSPPDPNDPKQRRIVLDEDHVIPIDESRFLLYYLTKANVFYKETIKQNSRFELQRELKKLLNL